MVNFSNVIDTELPVDIYHLYVSKETFDIDDIGNQLNTEIWIQKEGLYHY